MRTVINHPKQIGEFIRAVRKAKDIKVWNLEKLAKVSGYSSQALGSIETNRASPTIRTLLAIFQSLGCRLEVVYEEEKKEIKEVLQ